jgi:hypothetical protein
MSPIVFSATTSNTALGLHTCGSLGSQRAVALQIKDGASLVETQ